MNVKLKNMILHMIFLIAVVGCTLEGRITSNLSSSAPLQLDLNVQNSKTSRVTLEEGTLILASAVINKPLTKDVSLSVTITSSGGDTRVNERFTSYTRSILIPAGSISSFISIQTTNDLIYQGDDEEFTLTINASGDEGFARSSSSVTLVLQDNESMPTVSFLNATQNKNEDSSSGQISVELSNVVTNTVSVRVVAQDLTAAAGTDFNYTSQILTFAPGEVSKIVTFSLLNRPGIQLSRSFKLQLIDPNNAVVTSNTVGSQTKEHVVTILDVDRPNLAINDINVNEGAPANFTVSLSDAFSIPVTVDYTVSAVSAVAGTDVVISTGTVTVPANTTSAGLSVNTINNPAVCDVDKTFKVVLSNPTNATIGDSEGVGVIKDITYPTLTLSSSNLTVAEGANANVNVNLSTVCPTRAVSVEYSTSAGTATAVSDFSTASSAVLTIPAGNSSGTISIPTAGDTLDEDDETFNISIANPTNGTLGTATSTTVTITDDDLPPSVTLSSSSGAVSEGSGTPVTLTATLSALSGKNIVLPYALSGSATVTADYTITASPLSVTAGSLSATITLTPVDDVAVEGTEDVIVTLGSPTNATLGGTVAQTVSIIDNDLGAFTISGVIGASDATADTNLVNGVVPGLSWTSSASATGYKVSVLSDDLATVACAEQTVGNVLTYQFNTGACTLTASTYYRLRVRSTDGTNYQAASNNDYRFYVNASPSLVSNGEGPWYVMAGSSITINALGGASPTVGVVTDADGDSVSFNSVGAGTLGTVTFGGGTSFSYAVASDTTLHGVDSITYTIADSRGGTRSGTISIFVMQPYTWTGKVSSLWSTSGNWCGSIAADKRSCAGAGAAPGATSTTLNLYFDSTCVSTQCSPTMDSNVSVQGVRVKAHGFSQGASYTLTVGSNGWTQSGGVFTGSSGGTPGTMTTSSLTVTGGTFTSTAGTMHVGGNLTIGAAATFAANSGTVNINGFSVISMNSAQFYNLSTYTCSINLNNETITVNNDLTLNGGYNCQLHSGTLQVKRNLIIQTTDGYGIIGTALIKIIGNASGSTISGVGGSMPSLTIDTGTYPVTLSGTVRVNGNDIGGYTYISSGTFTSTGSTLSCFQCAVSPGTVRYNNVQLVGGVNLGGNSMNVDGNLTIESGYNRYLSNGTLLVKGNVICSSGSEYPSSPGDGIIKVIGNPSGSTISGSSSCAMSNLEIDAGSNNVTMTGEINLSGNWTTLLYKVSSVGTLTTTGSTLVFSAPITDFVPGAHMYNNVIFAATANKSMQGQTMNVGGKLTLQGYNSFSNGTFNVYGDILADNLGTGFSMSGGIVIKLKGNAAGQTVTSSSSTASIPNLVIDTGANNVTFATNVAIWNSLQVLSVGTLNVTGSTLYPIPGFGVDTTIDLGGRQIENLSVSYSSPVSNGVILNSSLVVTGNVSVSNSVLKMNGQNLTSNAVTMNAAGSITKSGGTLTVNGSVIGGTGSMYGGTVNP